MLTKATIRGCGTRKEGGAYLCLGVGPGGTLKVEDLVKDPATPWEFEFSRAPKIINNNVYMWVSANDYPSPWDFVEEMRLFGLSRRVSATFPFEQLTPGVSKLCIIFEKGIPKFDYQSFEHHPSCKIRKGLDFFDNEKLFEGHHTTIDRDDTCPTEELMFDFCTFAHKDLAPFFHWDDCYLDDENTTKIYFPDRLKPSFDYLTKLGHIYHDFEKPFDNESSFEEMVAIATNKKNWLPAVLLEVPITHVEFPYKVNQKVQARANQAGYQTFMTEW